MFVFKNKAHKTNMGIKKIFSVFVSLILALVIPAVSLSVYAVSSELTGKSGNYEYQRFYDMWHYLSTEELVWTGDCAVLKYSGSETNLTVPKKIAGYKVTNIAADAFKDCASLETVTLQPGVSAIEAYAFYGCSNLKKVYLPKTLQHVGYFSFSSCDDLTHIEVADGCRNFKDIDGMLVCMNDEDNAVSTDNLLVCCPGGKTGKIVVPEGIKTVEETCFFGCSKIHSIVLPKSVKFIGSHAFSACDGLKNINIPVGITEILTETFSHCQSLETIQIPEGVTKIGELAFFDCKSLKNVSLPSSLRSIGTKAFADCKSLTSLVIPDGVESISDGAFHNDHALEWLEIPDSVKALYGNPFSSDSGNVADGLTILCSSGSFAERYCKQHNIDYFLTDIESEKSERLSGSNRISTALEICREGWGCAETAILANGFSFPDALAGVPLSKIADAPILLTSGGTLESDVSAEIERLGAKKVYILGGSNAVSERIESALKNKSIDVRRLAGSDRYSTAVAIANEIYRCTEKHPTTIYFASAANFPDALAISPVAAIENNPILYLPKQGNIDDSTAQYLSEHFCSNAVIAGGTGAVSEAGEDSLERMGISVTRVSGNTRYETAMAICRSYKEHFDGRNAVVATGENFPDALAGGALAAKRGIPLMLVSEANFDDVCVFLQSCENERIYILGGKNVIPDRIAYRFERM